MTPERGGHSSVKVLLRAPSGSRSPSTAHAVTTLPPDCFAVPSAASSPAGGRAPSSSSNSRSAQARGSSASSYSPFGIDHAPRSFFSQ